MTTTTNTHRHRAVTLALAASTHCEKWQQLLGDWSADPARTFSNLPIVDKYDLFDPATSTPAQLLRDGRTDRIARVRMSSGTSGSVRAWACSSADDLASERELLNRALARICRSANARSLLILDMLPPGAGLGGTGATFVHVGPNVDAVRDVLDAIASDYEALVLVATPWFLKCALESYRRAGSFIQTKDVYVVLGDELLPESLRRPLAALAGCPPSRVSCSLGAAELGLDLLWETPATIELRRVAMNDAAVRTRLCGVELEAPPYFMTYDPQRLIIESVSEELVITCLEENRLQPMIRYNTHDRGGLVDLADLSATAVDGAELPEPLVWVAGRSRQPDMAVIAEVFGRVEAHSARLTGAFVLDTRRGVVDVQLADDRLSVSGRATLRLELEHELERSMQISPALELWEASSYPHVRSSGWQTKRQRSLP